MVNKESELPTEYLINEDYVTLCGLFDEQYLCPSTVQNETPHNVGSTLANSGIYDAFCTINTFSSNLHHQQLLVLIVAIVIITSLHSIIILITFPSLIFEQS